MAMRVDWSLATRAEKAICAFAVLNFLSFVTIATFLGGDALNGKAVSGHYFLAMHGAYTEVSYAAFIYSYAHGISAFLSLIVVLMTGIDVRRRARAKASGSKAG